MGIHSKLLSEPRIRCTSLTDSLEAPLTVNSTITRLLGDFILIKEVYC